MLPANTMDAVFLNDVIDYVERSALAGFLDGIRHALRPSGRLIIRDPNGGADRVIAECYRAGFSLVEAKIPLMGAPTSAFTDSWYALKLRVADRPQPGIYPRLGQPAVTAHTASPCRRAVSPWNDRPRQAAQALGSHRAQQRTV